MYMPCKDDHLPLQGLHSLGVNPFGIWFRLS